MICIKCFKKLTIFLLAVSSALFFCEAHAFDPNDDVFSTNLCSHEYDEVNKYYYCSKKISKIHIVFKFDDYYKKDGYVYSAFSKKIIMGEIQSIRKTVNQFGFEIINHDESNTIIMPKKNEALFYFVFSSPNFIEKKIDVTIFSSIDGKMTVIANKIKISGEKNFDEDLKKKFKDNYSCFIHLYALEI